MRLKCNCNQAEKTAPHSAEHGADSMSVINIVFRILGFASVNNLKMKMRTR